MYSTVFHLQWNLHMKRKPLYSGHLFQSHTFSVICLIRKPRSKLRTNFWLPKSLQRSQHEKLCCFESHNNNLGLKNNNRIRKISNKRLSNRRLNNRRLRFSNQELTAHKTNSKTLPPVVWRRYIMTKTKRFNNWKWKTPLIKAFVGLYVNFLFYPPLHYT